MSIQNELEQSGLIGTSRNVNLVMTSEENMDDLLNIYKEEIQSSKSFSEYILSVEDESQSVTEKSNNCTIENGVYAEAFVLLNRFDNHETYETDDMAKVWDTASELVERGYNQKASEIGAEIDKKYSIKSQTYEKENEEGWNVIEDEDAAIIS